MNTIMTLIGAASGAVGRRLPRGPVSPAAVLGGGRFVTGLLAAACLAGVSARSGWAAPGAFKEYDIKAAFLIHFTEFVEWPDNAFPSDDTPITIGVLGENVFGNTLARAVETTTVRNRKLAVKQGLRIEDLKGCHVLFIGKSERGQTPEVLAGLRDRCVLTVGETDGFASQGGIINFYLDGNKVRFEINSSAARRHRLKMSAQLLSLGKLVDSEPIKENP